MCKSKYYQHFLKNKLTYLEANLSEKLKYENKSLVGETILEVYLWSINQEPLSITQELIIPFGVSQTTQR